MTLENIEKMDTKEKIILMNSIWESLDQQVDSPLWHEEVLQARNDKIENGTAQFVSLEELKNL